MLTYTNNPTDKPDGPEPTPGLSLKKAPAEDGCPLKLALDDSADAIRHVSHALGQAQRRLDNLRDLIDRFELDDDDGPRAA